MFRCPLVVEYGVVIVVWSTHRFIVLGSVGGAWAASTLLVARNSLRPMLSRESKPHDNEDAYPRISPAYVTRGYEQSEMVLEVDSGAQRDSSCQSPCTF